MNTRRLIGIIFLAFVLFQCTEEPPAELFQGTAADTNDIMGLMQNVDTLMTTPTIFAEGAKLADTLIFGKFYWEDSLSQSNFWTDDQEALGCSIRIKTHPYQFGRVVTSVACDTTLLFGIDTTCVVYLDHTFDGNILYQVDVLCSLFYKEDPPGSTAPDLDSAKFDSVDLEISKDLSGSSRQAFFFDLDENGDWELMKVSCMTEYLPTTDSAISTKWLVVKTASKTDTVFYRQPDPTKPENAGKYGMNQLIPTDSLISVFTNEDVTFEFHTNYALSLLADSIFWRIYATIDGSRTPDTLVAIYNDIDTHLSGSLIWKFTTAGTKYITFEVLDANVGYYSGLAAEGSYGHYSTIWRVPIEVK